MKVHQKLRQCPMSVLACYKITCKTVLKIYTKQFFLLFFSEILRGKLL